MAKVITPRDARHAERLAKALIEAAGDQHHAIVRTATGMNGLVFVVDDDELADRVVAEVGEADDPNAEVQAEETENQKSAESKDRETKSVDAKRATKTTKAGD